MFGSDDCPCLKKYPSQLDALSLANNTSNEFCNFVNEFGAEYQLPKLNCNFPPDYDLGISCKAHDRIYRADCQGPVTPNTPHYCFAKWCYVDQDECFHSNNTYFEDAFLPGLYYSYSTCSGSTSFDYLEEERFNTLNGANITVVLPEYVFPLSFKREILPNNTFSVFEYTDLQGAIIEYFDLIREETSIKSLTYKIRSNGSRKKFGNSNYTAAVNDVSNQLADIGGGVFWVTAERLNLAPFTVPLFYSPLYLYELKKGQERPFVLSFQNTLRPFSNYLWLVLVVCVIIVGIVNVFTSNARSHKEWHQLLHSNHQKSSSRFQRTTAGLRVYTSSINESFVKYFGAASQTAEMSTLSHKILVFGFGLFIFILYSTYTSILASSLISQNFRGYVQSMDEAIESNLKICAQTAIQESLTTEFPKLKRDNMKYIPLTEYNYISEATNKLKTGECNVMVADELDLQFINPGDQEEFCKNELVSIKAPVMTLYVAMPVEPLFQADLSKAMMDLGLRGIEFQDVLKQYSPPLNCEIYLDPTNIIVRNPSLSVEQMSFPMGFLILCLIIGIIFKITVLFRNLRLSYDLERENDEDVDVSLKMKNLSREDEDFTPNSYIDMLEYKYRLDLVSLNVEQLKNRMAKHLENYQDRKYD